MNDEAQPEASDRKSEVGAELPVALPTLVQVVAGMSAEQRYQKFRDMLKERGMTISELSRLATKSTSNWPHVTQVLRGVRKGQKTWPRLEDFLTPDELTVLGRKTASGPERPTVQREGASFVER